MTWIANYIAKFMSSSEETKEDLTLEFAEL